MEARGGDPGAGPLRGWVALGWLACLLCFTGDQPALVHGRQRWVLMMSEPVSTHGEKEGVGRTRLAEGQAERKARVTS